MIARIDFSILRETRWYEYALRFVFGGIVTAAAGLIAARWGPVVGGLFLAFPAIFPATATLAEKREREKKQTKGMSGSRRGRDAAALEAVGSTLGSLGLLVFSAIVWRFLPREQPYAVLTVATTMWVVTSIAAWGVRRKFL